MTKQEKIASLSTAMTISTRPQHNDEEFYHFTDTVPYELKNLYLNHYNVADLDYETFNKACDIVSEVYADKPEATDNEATDTIYERSSQSASVYTYDRLQYLNNNNEEDISNTMRETGTASIADACGFWYDKQVEQAAIIIKDWINA